MEPLLELRDIHYAYHSINGETQALSNISFSVTDGEFIAIVGPSGCGNAMCQQRKQINGCHREKSAPFPHPILLYPAAGGDTPFFSEQ